MYGNANCFRHVILNIFLILENLSPLYNTSSCKPYYLWVCTTLCSIICALIQRGIQYIRITQKYTHLTPEFIYQIFGNLFIFLFFVFICLQKGTYYTHIYRWADKFAVVVHGMEKLNQSCNTNKSKNPLAQMVYNFWWNILMVKCGSGGRLGIFKCW